MFTLLHGQQDGIAETNDTQSVPELLKAQTPFWLDLSHPSSDEFRELASLFSFHPLAIEDAQKPHQRPKVDEYDGYFFVAADEAHYDASPAGGAEALQSRQIGVFVGANYLVTVDTAGADVIAAVRERCKRHPAVLLHGVDHLLYTLLDTIVDGYFPVLDALDEQMDGVEDDVLSGAGPGTLERIFAVKKTVGRLRRISGPLREAVQTLTTRDFPHIQDGTIPYLRDVADHLFRVYETLDVYRDLMSNMLDAYLTQVNNRMSRIMQRLTAVATVFMPITFLTGVFGMNFTKQPWANTSVWFWIALMVATGLGMYAWLRRNRWF